MKKLLFVVLLLFTFTSSFAETFKGIEGLNFGQEKNICQMLMEAKGWDVYSPRHLSWQPDTITCSDKSFESLRDILITIYFENELLSSWAIECNSYNNFSTLKKLYISKYELIPIIDNLYSTNKKVGTGFFFDDQNNIVSVFHFDEKDLVTNN